MFRLLVAYVQGRGGVLDDRGIVIDTEACGEWDPHDAEVLEREDEESVDLGEDSGDGIWRSVWRVVFFGGKMILGIVVMIWFLNLSWKFGGWVGHGFLGVPGVLGNIAGVAACLLVWAVLTLLGNRLTNARRDVRAQDGKQNLEDMHGIFYSVDQERLCGACGFSIGGFEPEEDGCVRCPECGAGWDLSLWEDFLKVDRAGSLKDLKKRRRKRWCMLDARGQMMQVLLKQSDESRNAEIRLRPARLALWDGFLLFVILLILGGGIFGAGHIILRFQQTMAGSIAVYLTVVALVIIAIFAVFLTRDGIWKRRLQKFVRDRIDDLDCPSCEEPLGLEPHPVDGALVCEGCGLAWDPATSSRRHHTRMRVPDEKYKDDPIFTEFSE